MTNPLIAPRNGPSFFNGPRLNDGEHPVSLERTDYPVRIRKKFASEAPDGIADELRRFFGRKCCDDFASAIVSEEAWLTVE